MSFKITLDGKNIKTFSTKEELFNYFADHFKSVAEARSLGYDYKKVDDRPKKTEVTPVEQTVEPKVQDSVEQTAEPGRTTAEGRESVYGGWAKAFPNTADATLRGKEPGFTEGFKDVFSLPGRAVAAAGNYLLGDGSEGIGTTNDESTGLVSGIVRNPYVTFGALTAPILGADMAAMGFGTAANAVGQGVLGAGISSAESLFGDSEEDKSAKQLLVDSGIGFLGGAAGESLASLAKYLVKRFSMSQARRIMEGMQFGNVNGNREITSAELIQALKDPQFKAIYDEAVEAVGHAGKRTTKLGENVDKYRKAFLDNAGNRNTQVLDPSIQDAEITGTIKAKNGINADNSTALNENLLETARNKPWDENAWAARQMAVNDGKRVSYKGYTWKSGALRNGGVQNEGNVGFTKVNASSIGNVFEEEGRFLDRLATLFERTAKEASGSYGDLNIRGQKYARSPEGVGKYLFDHYFQPLQEAAFGSKGITKEKLLDVMEFAAKQNDAVAMESILQAGRELGFSQSQIAEMLDQALRIGKEGKLLDLIKSGKDMSKYKGNLPLNTQVISAKDLNPMAGISRLARPAKFLTESTDIAKGKLNAAERGSRTLVNGDLLYGIRNRQE